MIFETIFQPGLLFRAGDSTHQTGNSGVYMYMRIASRQENAYTLIELLMGMFISAFAAVAYVVVRVNYGPGLAMLAAAVAVLVGVALVILFFVGHGGETGSNSRNFVRDTALFIG